MKIPLEVSFKVREVIRMHGLLSDTRRVGVRGVLENIGKAFGGPEFVWDAQKRNGDDLWKNVPSKVEEPQAHSLRLLVTQGATILIVGAGEKAQAFNSVARIGGLGRAGRRSQQPVEL